MIHFDEKFWLAIAFFTFLTAVLKLVWSKLAGALDNKSKQIAEEILQAKEMKEKAEALLAKAEKYYQESVSFAEKLLKDAEEESKKLALESKQALEDELKKKTSAALARIKVEQEAAIQNVKKKIISDAVTQLSENFGLDQNGHEKLVDKSIKNLEKTIH